MQRKAGEDAPAFCLLHIVEGLCGNEIFASGIVQVLQGLSGRSAGED